MKYNLYNVISETKKIVTTLTLILFCCYLYAQDTAKVDKVRLLSSDRLSFNKSINPDYQIFSGNVVFEYDGSLLYCQVAHIYLNRDYVVCFNDVNIIINDTTNIFGDTLIIDGDKNLVEIIGNVRLIDNKFNLTTDRLFYDLNTEIIYYLNGAKINDGDNFLTSKRGFYYSLTKEFFFSDSVYVQSPDSEIFSDSLKYFVSTEVVQLFGNSKIITDENTIFCESGTYDTKNDIANLYNNVKILKENQYLKADSVFYNKHAAFSEAFKNVEFKDSVENIMLNGEYGKFFENDSSFFITERALLRAIENTDTLYLHADTIFSAKDTSIYEQRLIHAHNMVRIFRNDFQAKCDSLVMYSKDSTLVFFSDPILWMEQTQLNADTIILILRNGDIDTMFLKNNSFIVSKENEKDFQQIKSQNMIGHFVNNELDVLWAYNNAASLYYIFDTDTLLVGINRTNSDKIRIGFEDRAVSQISFFNNPSGIMSPEKEMSETDKTLQGLRWEQSIRPKHRFDVFRNTQLQPEAHDISYFLESNFTNIDSLDSIILHNDSLTNVDTPQILDENRDSTMKENENIKSSDGTTLKSRAPAQQKENIKPVERKFFLARWINSLLRIFRKR